MDQILEMAKDIAAEIQADDRFFRAQLASAAADEDEELQGIIGEFNLKRLAVGTEAQKPEEERDAGKLQRLDAELRGMYEGIMSNPRMIAYNAAKSELDGLINGINRILMMAVQGIDPDEMDADASCGGNCSGCSGCH
ncbi:MAG: YlbF family regulator [Oscillospiraceae bacterium]|nr:YlbF family regulator [Oscillospiraceae bacterium]